MEERVKQRLVGAIVLVALAVIFIPMILRGPDDGNGSGSALPPPPKVVQQSLPALQTPGEVPPAPAEGLALGKPQDGSPAQSPAPAVDSQKSQTTGDSGASSALAPPAPVASTAPPVPAAQNDHAGASDADQALTAWVVQVGSFSRQDNAASLRDKLRAKGFKAFVEQASTTEGTVYRVEVGPILKRSDADSLRDKLQAQMQLKGLVTPHR
ncbi:MAG: SPOR domain-containing protein [Gammaproteobacteria bacterium]